MNEKLEQEIERYIKEKHLVPETFLIPSIAQHFYNLALEDVREMLERQQRANHTGTDEWIRAKAIAYESICDFIDEQSK